MTVIGCFGVVLTHCRTVMGTVNVHFGVTLIHCRTVMVYFGVVLTYCRTLMGYSGDCRRIVIMYRG